MLWSRTGREARRQKVLDELLEVAPADRARRLEEAVAAGDVRESEVAQAKRLVDRLDALRVMTIPHVDGGIRAARESDPEGESRIEDVAPEPAASVEDERTPSSGRVANAKERRARARKGSKPRVGAIAKPRRSRTSKSRMAAISVIREPEAVPIEPEMTAPAPRESEAHVAADARIVATPMPIDAVEAAARLIARDVAARKAARASGVPRRRVHRPGNQLTLLDEQVMAGAGGQPADPVGPSIDWLRP